jgi:hypothetical protein
VLGELLDRDGVPDGVRMRSAGEILSRTGLKPGTAVDLTVREEQDPGEILRERLEILATRAKKMDPPPRARDSGVRSQQVDQE